MPFYMGIDETRYGFMDEGWATTLEYLWGVDLHGEEAAGDLFKPFRVNRWEADPSAAGDLPIITPGDVLGGEALGINEYGKAALGYLAVKDLLGDEVFRSCLHAYMERWNGKHPNPWDFFYTFDDVANRSLDWFWNNWFFSPGHIDLAVVDVSETVGGYAVTLENIGGMDAPVDLVLEFADGSSRRLHQTPAIWEASGLHATVQVEAEGRLTSVGLDHGIWVDADTSNDGWSRDRG
jgi:aminopeptidase N